MASARAEYIRSQKAVRAKVGMKNSSHKKAYHNGVHEKSMNGSSE